MELCRAGASSPAPRSRSFERSAGATLGPRFGFKKELDGFDPSVLPLTFKQAPDVNYLNFAIDSNCQKIPSERIIEKSAERWVFRVRDEN